MAGKLKIDFTNFVTVTKRKDRTIEEKRADVVESLKTRGLTLIDGVAYISLRYGTTLIKDKQGNDKIPVGKMSAKEAKAAMPEVLKLVEAELNTGKWDKEIEKISKKMSERGKTKK